MKSLSLLPVEKNELEKFARIVNNSDPSVPKNAFGGLFSIKKALENNDFLNFFELVSDYTNDELFTALCKVLINAYDGFENILKQMDLIPEDALFTRLFRHKAILIPHNIKTIGKDSLKAWMINPSDRITAVFIPESVTYLDKAAVHSGTIVCFECDRAEAYRNIKGDFNFESDRCWFNYTREKFIKEFDEDII